jgi:acyl-phosphate glycerol 3-phosphate acyltransferase
VVFVSLWLIDIMLVLVLFGLTLLCSYLVGAIPFGFLVARWRGVDIFQAGSGNIGATNVGRVLGRGYGILVFILDFAKGAVPVTAAGWLARALSGDGSDAVLGIALPVSAGLAAFLGHLFPIYLRFHGGKGVATGAGVVTILLPGPTLAALLAWVGIVCLSRCVSLASLAAGVVLCSFYLVSTTDPFHGANWILTSFAFLAVGLVFVRHWANIHRLLQGNENRLKETNAMMLFTKTIHVLALGLWFGAVVFFLIVALVLFHTFEELGVSAEHRPSWLGLPGDFSKDQGTRLAGIAVAPLFKWYYPLQVVGGFLAVCTALSWVARPSKTQDVPPGRQYGVHRLRALILLLALISVALGWPLANYVNELRLDRYDSNPAIAEPAQQAFGTWHGISLLLNFTTIGLVTVAMALAAQLPIRDQESGVRSQESAIGCSSDS